MLDVELFGLDGPGGHHLVSVVLHAGNALLLLAALLALTRSFWPSAIVAAFFAWHPLRVESVAWVAERKDVLAGTFWMLALLAYARWVRAPSRGRYLALMLAMALGLLAKPMLVTLPFVLLLLDAWPLRRWRGFAPADGAGLPAWRLVAEKGPLLLFAAGSCAMTLWAQTSGGCTGFLAEGVTAGQRLVNAVLAYARYLAHAFWPTKLAVFYPHAAVVDPEAARLVPALIATLVLLLVSAWAWARARSRAPGSGPALLVGWLWFLGTLVPVIGAVQVGGQALADRYAYLPLIGIQLAVVFGAAELVARRPVLRPLATAAAAAALVACLVLTHRQVAVWRDTVTLFEHALVVTERNYVAHVNLGRMYGHAERIDQARVHFEEAVRLVPDFYEARVNLGWALYLSGETERARAELEVAVRLQPENADARYKLGLALAELERLRPERD